MFNFAIAFLAQTPAPVTGAVGTLYAAVKPTYERLSAALMVAQVEVTPSADGFPGGAMAQKILNWAGQLGLWGSLLSILVGACIWGVSQHFGNGLQTGKGKILVGAGAIGAVITGLGAVIVNTLFNAARA